MSQESLADSYLEEILGDIYPKVETLKDGTEITVKLLESGDKEELVEFFRHIQARDRMFLKDDVTDESVIQGWCTNIDLGRVIPLVAKTEGKIVADATLHHQKMGWMRRVGQVRVVVHSDYRRRGLSALLLSELSDIALHAGLDRLNAECMIEQHGAIQMFLDIGYIQAATLADQVIDLRGQPHDLVILVNDLRDREYPELD